jgi:phosphoribosylamine--glycine ligase
LESAPAALRTRHILIVGGGGREHALAFRCAQSPQVAQVLVAPGNAGTAREERVANAGVEATDLDGLVALARAERIDLTLIGPEAPLVAGIVDRFAREGLRCFGPTRTAARLEGSKVYAKQFLARHGIPSAAYRMFTAGALDETWIRAQRLPLVVKADGLAAGKGVIICDSHAAALDAARDMLSGASFGSAGSSVVVEEFLEGEEASFIVVAAGTQVIPLATSQDHKRRDAGDRGPNTGGMGAYSPAPVISAALHERVMRDVITPTLAGLAREGIPYTGFLYAGLMIAPDGTPNVLEFNCRLGDPEAQPILMRLQSDLVALCDAALDGTLDRAELRWDPRAALGVVMAAPGYPEAPRVGDLIEGLEAAALRPGKVFHSGTRLQGTATVTAGGRVLCAVGLGADVGAAQRQAYDLVRAISFPGAIYRSDIGYRALEREHRA